MSSFVSDKFFPVVRAGLDIPSGSGSESIILSETECEILRKLGLRQDIIPVIWRGLKKKTVPDEWLDKIEQNKTKCMYKFILRDDALKKICNVFEEAEISYIILKGAEIKNLYPEEWMRTSLDIDILVHEYDIDGAVRAVERETDFKTVNRTFHDVSLVNNVIQLELHFNLKENVKNVDAVLENVWSYAQSVDGSYRYKLTPEYNIFYIIAHMCYHMLHGGVGIRAYIDFWLLKNKTLYDEIFVRHLCEDGDILRFYDVCCDAVAVWFDGLIREDITEELERYCLMGGAYGYEEQFFKVNQRDKQGLRYILRRIFAEKDILQKDYPKLIKYPFLIPYYQVRRWFRLFDKKLFKSVKNEIKVVKETNKEDVESFDKLLRDIGL